MADQAFLNALIDIAKAINNNTSEIRTIREIFEEIKKHGPKGYQEVLQKFTDIHDSITTLNTDLGVELQRHATRMIEQGAVYEMAAAITIAAGLDPEKQIDRSHIDGVLNTIRPQIPKATP